MSSVERTRKELITIQKADPQNKICVECSTSGTNFVDVKIGCFLCIDCAGLHRNFGTDICRVKSINLDNFSVEELSMFTFTKGNAFVNKRYEGYLTNPNPKNKYQNIVKKPVKGDPTAKISDFIRRKYVTKEFYMKEELQPQKEVQSAEQARLPQESMGNKTIPISNPVTKTIQKPTQVISPQTEIPDLIDFSNIVTVVEQPPNLAKQQHLPPPVPTNPAYVQSTNLNQPTNPVHAYDNRAINDIMKLFNNTYY